MQPQLLCGGLAQNPKLLGQASMHEAAMAPKQPAKMFEKIASDDACVRF